MQLTDAQKAAFSYRSYHAVDGLWFMKIEERFGFDTALEIDHEVWKVLPKIQARMLKTMTDRDTGLEGLYRCFALKLDLEEFRFQLDKLAGGAGFRVHITGCPWHDAMVKSNRESLSGTINTLICQTEYTVWAAEFDTGITVNWMDRICTGGKDCTMEFRT